MDNDFTDKMISPKFSSLKRNLRRHLQTSAHLKKEEDMKAGEEQREREETRNRAVGMKIGRLVYHLVRHARPDADLTELIYLTNKAGADVGDFSHSHNMVGKLLPSLSGAVENRVTKFLGTRMVATGCLPPVNIMADKATDMRETRQLVGVLTYNPVPGVRPCTRLSSWAVPLVLVRQGNS